MSDYLIAHIGHTRKDCEHITWWKPDSRGYTFCIDKAGLYDEAEARSICSGGGACIAVPKSVAAPLAHTTPYYRRADGTLNKLYDGGPHAVVPNDLQIWKTLLSGRLERCDHPDKPTPIGAKARAIYIDGITEGGAA
jgi:hypothetical protein